MNTHLPIQENSALANIGSPLGQPRAFDTIVWGGLIAGTLDAVDAVIAFGLLGMNQVQVLQFISTGLLGPEAFKGGLPAAALGAALHYLIAFAVAAVYYTVALRAPGLVRKPVVFGLAFGAAVYLVMNYFVLPLSAVPRSQFSLALFLNGIIGHALFVGLPIALLARRSARASR